MNRIEIIIPVYNGASALADCLDSLSGRLPEWASVQLVDDGSDSSEVADLLAGHALLRRPDVRVFSNERNLGFVASVNRAMARSACDVVLLNSDTIVAGDWLSRLRDCAASDARIASATPFSNNAEICSLPRFCQINPVPGEPDRIAEAVAGAGQPEYPDLPTGVGFCMYMRRAALDAIGDFDVATFGRGYGEENDWCLRAAGHGWRNVLCDDAYVAHVGGVSFAATGERPGGEQLARLVARYPHYNALVADFISRDPLALRRQAVADCLSMSTVPSAARIIP